MKFQFQELWHYGHLFPALLELKPMPESDLAKEVKEAIWQTAAFFKDAVVTKTGDTTYNNDDLDDAIFCSFVRFFCSFFRSFKKIQKIGRVAAMILLQKSSKSELSSPFVGR